MTKNIWWLATFLILAGLLPASSSAEEIPPAPVPLFPEATITSAKFYLYEHLNLNLKPFQDGKGQLSKAGNLWEIWIDCPEENQTVKTHYLELATSSGAILADASANDLHFRYDHPDGSVYVRFHAQNGKYSLKILRPAPLHSQVVFGDGQYADPNSGDQGDSPQPPLISDYPQSNCYSFTFNEFNQLNLEYKVNRKTISKTAEGRYWHKRIEMNNIPGRPTAWVTPADINETMRAAVLAAGGEVLSGEDRELIFHLENKDVGDLWAKLWPQDGHYSIQIIQEKAMQQVLVFDADTMMARLDALGVLTLDGIYFDTAKATLKTESGEALQAALKLMNDYPDLVLEVGGHTDNVGQAPDNENLSQGRASSVRQWLTGAGVEPTRLEAKGYGEEWPVADNGTESGRAANRRVELKKLSGGQVRTVMSLIKPYPGSEDIGHDEKSAQYEVQIYEKNSNGRLQERTVIGTGFCQYYQVLNEAGQYDEKLSGIQIRRNYIQAVNDFGGTILAEDSHGLYFRLDNLDGSSTYVSVWAPGSKYQVTAVTP